MNRHEPLADESSSLGIGLARSRKGKLPVYNKRLLLAVHLPVERDAGTNYCRKEDEAKKDSRPHQQFIALFHVVFHNFLFPF